MTGGGLQISTLRSRREASMAVYKADRKLWLTVDNRVVEDGDPAAHHLLITPGKTMPEALAVRYGLMEPSSGGWVADRKLFLTADGERVVEENDPEAATLWVTPGKVVARDQALKHGLLTVDPVEPPPDALAEEGEESEDNSLAVSDEAALTEESAENSDAPELHENPEPAPASRRRREAAVDGE